MQAQPLLRALSLSPSRTTGLLPGEQKEVTDAVQSALDQVLHLQRSSSVPSALTSLLPSMTPRAPAPARGRARGRFTGGREVQYVSGSEQSGKNVHAVAGAQEHSKYVDELEQISSELTRQLSGLLDANRPMHLDAKFRVSAPAVVERAGVRTRRPGERGRRVRRRKRASRRHSSGEKGEVQGERKERHKGSGGKAHKSAAAVAGTTEGGMTDTANSWVAMAKVKEGLLLR